MPEQAAVIGGGIGGLTAAREIAEGGAEVTVLDKGRGFGGRLSTRRVDFGGETLHFNHGAPALHVRGEVFRKASAELVAEGAARWEAEDRLVGEPHMNTLVAAMGDGLDVRFESRVGGIEPAGAGWRLRDGEGAEIGVYKVVVSAIPAPQVAALLAPVAPDLAEAAGRVRFEPAWVAMLGFEQDAGPEADVPGDGEVVERVVRTSGRAWTVHATAAWSAANLEREKDDAAGALAEAAAAAEPALGSPSVVLGHRWRHARAAEPLGDRFLFDDRGLLVCGDGFGGVDGESSFLSGVAAGRRAAERLSARNAGSAR